MNKKQRIGVIAAVAILLFAVVVGVFTFSGAQEIVISEFNGKKVLLGDYDCFIEFNRRITLRDNRNFIAKSLKYSYYLAKRDVKLTDADIDKAFAELLKEYSSNEEIFTDYYIPIAKSAKIEYNSFRESLRYYAAAVAVTELFNNYAKGEFEKQDKDAEGYISELDSFVYSLEKEALKEEASIVTSFSDAQNAHGVSNYEKHYEAFIGLAGEISKFETVQSITLYIGIDKLYGKEADMTQLEAYLVTIYSGLTKIDGYEGILNDMGSSDFELWSEAKKFYRNVYVYEQLTQDYFASRFQLKKTAGTLPEGVTTLEEYTAYILIDTALMCKVVNTDFEWNRNQK